MATILVTDDRPVNRQFLITLLGYSGHRLLEAADGAEGLEITRAERPDLIITDILMPTMDGYEFVRRLRAEPDLAHTPVIFYTATYREREARALANACGVTHVISKPSAPEIILQTVNAALGLTDAPLIPQVDEPSEHSPLTLMGEKLTEKVREWEMVSLRLSSLIELGLELASERDPQQLLGNFCRAAQDIIGAKYAAVGVLDDDGQRLAHFFTTGIDAEILAHMGPPLARQGVLGELLAEGRPRRLRDLKGDPQAVGLARHHPPIDSFLGTPFGSPVKVYGWLYLANKLGAREFSQEDERIALTLAAQVAIAYEDAKLNSEIQRRTVALEQQIAERQQAEEALEQSREWLRAILAAARDGKVVEKDEMIVFANQAFASLYGYDGPEELIGQHVSVVQAEEDNARMLEFGRRRVRGEPTPPVYEFKGRRRDGTVIDLEAAVSTTTIAGETYIITGLREITERKRVEELLRTSEERLRLAFEAGHMGTWDWNMLTGKITWSDNLEALYGLAPGTFGKTFDAFLNLVHPADRESVAQAVARAVEERSHFDNDFRVIWPDGSLHWNASKGQVFTDEAGRPVRMIGVGIDITERKQTEEEKFQAANQLQLLLSSVGEGIYGIDLQGNCTLFNRAASEMTGYQPAEAVGRNIHDLIHHSHPDGSPYPVEQCPIIRAFKQGQTYRGDDEVLWRRDGTAFPVEYSSFPIIEEGVNQGAVVTFTDITERKRAEEALRLSEEKYRSLVMNIPDVTWTADSEGHALYVSPNIEKMYGFTAEEICREGAQHGFGRIHPDDYERVTEAFGWLFTRGEKFDVECRLQRKDGEWIWAQIKAMSTYEKDGVLYADGVLSEITERKQAEEALFQAKLAAEEANLLKSQFLANMSHELRTPMNGIIGMTELTLETAPTPEQREYLEMAQTSAHALLALINDILDFSKLDLGKLSLDRTPFTLHDSLGDSVKKLARRAQQKGIKLACHLSTKVPKVVVGDPGRLRQVFVNLVGNAIKFTERGEVIVRVETDWRTDKQAVLHFTVADTGIGIPREKQQQIFDPFTQADGSTTRQYGGTGLGLAIASQLVGIMGGRLWVESEVGQGSTFHFTIRFGLPQASLMQPVMVGR